ncbi:MAG: 4Fe-4S dicluster domain-containing protein [Archaeoglobaceae archaeon]
MRIVVKPEVCMGCQICEIWCLVAHSMSKDILNAFLLEKPRPKSRIVVERSSSEYLILQCRNCEEPKCMFACISGAIYRDNGVLKYNEEKCVACLSCVMACPYGAVKFEDGKIVRCDLCNLDPVCVKVCPNKALEVVS